MLCTVCGQQNNSEVAYCAYCGTALMTKQDIEGNVSGNTEVGQPLQGATQYPAGWYPDPSISGMSRYWDGLGWTKHTSSSPERSVGGGGIAVSGGSTAYAVADAVNGKAANQGKIYAATAAVVIVVVAVVGAVMLFASGNGNSPDGVVNNYVNSFFGGTPTSACRYVLPSQQPSCHTQMTALVHLKIHLKTFSISGHVQAGQSDVEGSRALVSLTGKICGEVSGSPVSCHSNSNPSLGLPTGGMSFQRVFDNAVSSGPGGSQVMPCVRQNGQWYVDQFYT